MENLNNSNVSEFDVAEALLEGINEAKAAGNTDAATQLQAQLNSLIAKASK